MKLLKVCLNLLAATTFVYGAPANPKPSIYYQPDGSETPQIYLRGNQVYNWLSDEKGYTILKDDEGWYTYAIKSEDGDLKPSGFLVGSKNPKKLGIVPNLLHAEHKRPINGLEPETNESVREHRSLLQIPENAMCGFSGSKNSPCRLRGIVFLVQFSDHASRVLPTQQEYDVLFNNNGPDSKIAPTGSVNDVFFQNSYQTFVMQSYITPWIKVSRTEAQTVDGNMGLNKPGTIQTWTEAIGLFDKMKLTDLNSFDTNKDGSFDCVVIMHSGSAAETGGNDCETGKDMNGRIWSHATASELYSTGTSKVNKFYVASAVYDKCPPGGKGTKWNIARIAVIAHECAHFLGLPDLYDTVGGQGVGTFDLMGNMWGWNGDQWYPPLMGSWSKLKLGWNNIIHVKGAGTYKYTMGPACTSADTYYVDHRLKDGEYFLLEYRFPCGFDKDFAHKDWQKDRSGLAIWHVDESGLQPEVNYQSEGIPGKSKLHYAVALVQGDGLFHLEKESSAGGNKGDTGDLLMDCKGYKCGKAKKIDNTGITGVDGKKLPEPSTKGYAGGTSYDTGITFEVGAYAATLPLTITLEGTDPEPNTFPGVNKKGTSPGIPNTTPPPVPVPATAPRPGAMRAPK